MGFSNSVGRLCVAAVFQRGGALARVFLDAVDLKLLGYLRGLFERGGSPEKLSRGVAAGVLGAFFPSAIFRFAAALLAALFFRGNKAAALLVPALAGVFEFQWILRVERSLAVWVWPSGQNQLAGVAASMNAANLSWAWQNPLDSLFAQFAALFSLNTGTGFALGGAALLVGGCAGVSIYPVSLIALSFFYDAKFRTQQYLELADRPRSQPFVIPPPPPNDVPVDYADLQAHYCDTKHRIMNGEAVRLLIDGGEAYPEMLAAIASARSTLVLETYILRDDKFGNLFAAALRAAARRGVKTRVICDGVGSIGLPPEFLGELSGDGVEVRIFHPISAFWRGGYGFLQRRDHRKIIVADAHVSLLGGLNIADEYAAVADGGGGWRDTHVRIDGAEAARVLTKIFEETWRKAEPVPGHKKHRTEPPVDPYKLPPLSGEDWTQGQSPGRRARNTSENLPMQILSNHELLMRMRIKRAYLCAFRAARRYILIENAFFIPDRDVLRALYKAVRRGVKVGVVVAMKHDIRVAAMASRALYDELLSHGVRLFEYPISMIHSKVAAIDDRWSIVSSYNLNHRSLIHDLEVGVLFCDTRFTVALRDQILTDIGKCDELTKELHRSRSWNIALTESVCYQFRYWL